MFVNENRFVGFMPLNGFKKRSDMTAFGQLHEGAFLACWLSIWQISQVKFVFMVQGVLGAIHPLNLLCM